MDEIVIMLRFDAERVPDEQSIVAAKRASVWRNRQRNQFIADLAGALTETPNQTVESFGVDRRVLDKKPQQRIAILVESPEHAGELISVLRGWWEVHDRGVYDCEPRDDIDDIYDPEATLPTGIIVTLIHHARNTTNADVLIRATGGYGKLSDLCLGKDRGRQWLQPRLLIDIADHRNGRPIGDTVRRAREYAEEERNVVHAACTTAPYQKQSLVQRSPAACRPLADEVGPLP